MTESNMPEQERTYISDHDESIYRRTIVRESLSLTALRARLVPDVVERYTDPLVRTKQRKMLAALVFSAVAVGAIAGYPSGEHDGPPSQSVSPTASDGSSTEQVP